MVRRFGRRIAGEVDCITFVRHVYPFTLVRLLDLLQRIIDCNKSVIVLCGGDGACNSIDG